MLLRLHQAISAVCPVVGVRADGTFDPAPNATPEEIAAAQAAVAAFDWSEQAQQQWQQKQNALAAAALLQSNEPIPLGARASDVVLHELRNNLAELFGVFIKYLNQILALPVEDREAAIIAWIAAERLAWEQAGGVWAEEPPAPSEGYATGTDRVQRDELLPMVAGAVAAGA